MKLHQELGRADHTQNLSTLRAGTVFEWKEAHYMKLDPRCAEGFGALARIFEQLTVGFQLVVHLGAGTVERIRSDPQVLRVACELRAGISYDSIGHG